MNDREDFNLADTAAIIEAFGGIRPMAHKLDVPVSTVQGWKQRDAIPANRADDILAAAAAHGVDLSSIGSVSEATEAASSGRPAEAKGSHVPPQKREGDGPRSDRAALAVAIIALVIALGAGGWILLGDGGQGAGPGGDSADISDRLNALEATVKTPVDGTSQRQLSAEITQLRGEIERVAGAQIATSTSAARLGEIDTRLQAAESELEQVQRRTASDSQTAAAALSAAQSEIAQLRQQLAALGENRSSTAQNVSDAVGLALAAGRLQRAMDKGAPYQDVLINLRAASTSDATIGVILDRLAGRAGAGIPTREALTRSFSGVARAVVSAAEVDAAAGWTDRTLQRIRSVASVRRIGPDVPGDAPDARIARAEGKLLGGDFAGAVAELDDLSGAAASAAASWRDGARARLDADIAVGEIEALAIARLQSGSGGS
jgi:hypothetical protein